MRLLLIVLITTILVAPFRVYQYVSPVALVLQKYCTQQVPPHQYSAMTAALVCGKSHTHGKEKQLLIQSSLYHLIVVSGTHLTIVSLALQKIFQRRTHWLFHIFLLLYCLLTGAQAPVVRALISIYLLLASQFWRWNWSMHWIQVSGTVLCLIIFPDWISSWSLLLSSLASLALTLPFASQMSIFFTLMIPLSLHPSSIIFNLLLTPFLEMFLFPLSILTILLPPVSHLADSIYDLFFWILEKYLTPLSLRHQPMALPLFWFWAEWIFIFLAKQFFRKPRWSF